MFSKTQDDRSHGGGSGQVSVLASDLVITGVVTSEGTIELHGNIDGEMSAAYVVIGADGRMKGKVHAGQVELRGEMDGAINCGALTLRSQARMRADVHSTRLVIESGAEVEGRFSRPAPATPARPETAAAPAQTTQAIEPAAEG